MIMSLRHKQGRIKNPALSAAFWLWDVTSSKQKSCKGKTLNENLLTTSEGLGEKRLESRTYPSVRTTKHCKTLQFG